jgi:hypothetical protein
MSCTQQQQYARTVNPAVLSARELVALTQALARNEAIVATPTAPDRHRQVARREVRNARRALDADARARTANYLSPAQQDERLAITRELEELHASLDNPGPLQRPLTSSERHRLEERRTELKARLVELDRLAVRTPSPGQVGPALAQARREVATARQQIQQHGERLAEVRREAEAAGLVTMVAPPERPVQQYVTPDGRVIEVR